MHTIWTRVIFEMSHVKHTISAAAIVNKFLLECGVHLS